MIMKGHEEVVPVHEREKELDMRTADQGLGSRKLREHDLSRAQNLST